MVYSTSDFGEVNGANVILYTLQNDNGLTVKIMNYGATITSLKIPNRDGEKDEIVCGFDSFDDYLKKDYLDSYPYFGATIGRYPSRIKDASFVLNKQIYTLSKNDGENTLHGGENGYDKRIFESKLITDNPDELRTRMSLKSPHLDQGFPGNFILTVEFVLNNNDELTINYLGDSDADTPCSITNHTYFNLSGFKSTVEDHKLQINATAIQEWDVASVATNREILFSQTAFDCSTPKRIGTIQNKINGGLDHCYILNNESFQMIKAATISCEQNKRSIEVYTTEPTMILYTGKHISNALRRNTLEKYGKYSGFCCETQRYPNGIKYQKPGSILKPGEKFESTTSFKFKY